MAKAVIIDDSRNIKIVKSRRLVKINDVVPFRVRFTNIMVPGYGSNNIPGIGIQVIGYSNYIL